MHLYIGGDACEGELATPLAAQLQDFEVCGEGE